MVRIHLLGGVGVVTDGGAPVDVGPPKCQAVLAALTLSVGEAVPVSRLVDVVWGDDPPASAEKTLQGYIARLRKGLGHDVIARSGAAYRLTVAPAAVDVARFQRYLDAGDIDAALADWGGAPLAGLDVPGLRAAVDGLVEQWLGAVEADLDRRVATAPQAAIAPLAQLTTEHPFREGLWALLMRALYRAGRQGDALAAFQRARQHLVDELGVEPGPELRELEALILDHHDDLRGEAPLVASEGRPSGTVTFGFCEVADAARLWVEHQRKMAAAMARLDALVRAAADRQGGTVTTAGGESFGAAFHRAEDAAAWATELRMVVEREPWPGGVDVRLRVGLHTGESEASDGGRFSPPAHTAAYLAAAGHGGQTLVSGTAAGLLEREDLRHLGAHRLEGVEAEHEILQLGAGEHPPLRTASARRGNLPRGLDRLVGRDADLDEVAQALEASPVVTLVGPGGVGKTTLALAAARRADAEGTRRVWRVELAEVTSPEEVPRAVADTLGVVEGAGRSLTDSVIAVAGSHPTLLVLDNCEHVIEGAAALARAVAERCPGAQALATSRESLGIPGERLVSVAPLDPAGAAADLFAERAQAVSGDFDPAASRAEVEEICRRLDGLPLAIELAAARTRSLTPAQLLARLDDRLRLLAGGRRSGAVRHRALRATIQWSHDLLSPEQQALFQRLSMFPGPFDLGAAEAVAADAAVDAVDVDHLLGDLVERSMVTVESGPLGRRFRLLETLRQFAAERLAEHGDPEVVADRHARWCREQVARLGGLLTGPGEIEGVARLGELWPSLRAAVDRACETSDLELADALVRPIASEVNLRRRAEIGDWAERILAMAPADDEDRVVLWLAWAADRHMQAGDHEAYEALIGRHGHAGHPLIRYTRGYLRGDGEELCACAPAAVEWLRERREEHAAAMTELLGLASGLLTLARFDELEALASTMVRRHRRDGPPTLLYWALGMLGYCAHLRGEREEANERFAESAGVHVPAGTTLFHKPAEARAIFERGERARGIRILRDHVAGLLDSDYTDVARLVAIEYVNMMVAIGRLPEAARALAYLDTIGDFGTLARETVLADAVRIVATTREAICEPSADPACEPDGRRALTDMHAVLDELARHASEG